MKVGVVTLFPEMFTAVSEVGISGRAVASGRLEVACFNPRDFTSDKHRTVDDKPFGGGPGMLMKVEPLRAAIAAAKRAVEADAGVGADTNQSADAGAEGIEGEKGVAVKSRVVYLSPQGKPLTQRRLVALASEQSVVLVAGRYEGIDERLLISDIDEEISIGDYVLSGGEIPAMVLIDGIARLLPGAVGDPESVVQDSFSEDASGVMLLDHPHYTRPEVIEADTDDDRYQVPTVLLSGDHEKVRRWRRKAALRKTLVNRPDLLEGANLDDELREMLAELRSEGDSSSASTL